MKRKVYTSRGQKQADFFAGFFVLALLLVLTPAFLVNLRSEGPVQGATGPILALAFLLLAGIYRPWMAIGGLGCLGALIALGLLAALFTAVVCSSGFR